MVVFATGFDVAVAVAIFASLEVDITAASADLPMSNSAPKIVEHAMVDVTDSIRV